MKKNRCKNCKQKMFYKWELTPDSQKTTRVINGSRHYKASCPLCGSTWYVKKKEDRVYHNYNVEVA